MSEYMIAFSSFYKAVYAQEKAQEKNVWATLKKTPPGILKSCGYALYFKTDDVRGLVEFLDQSLIDNRGVYRIAREAGETTYQPV